MDILLNDEQRLFIFTNSEYINYIGFDVVFKHCLELTSRIKQYKLLQPDEKMRAVLASEIGTLDQYEQYKNLLAIVGDRKIGTWFDYDTPVPVRKLLERYRKDGGRLRLFYGDRATGRCWMEENDVLGCIGRSMGPMQIPLLIADGECCGPGVLDRCIVRIVDADSREELYRHKHYHLPEMEIRTVDATLASKGYTHSAWVNGKEGRFENYANFRSYGKAAHWVAFMSGDCTVQP